MQKKTLWEFKALELLYQGNVTALTAAAWTNSRFFQSSAAGGLLIGVLRFIHHAPYLCVEFTSLIIQTVVSAMINDNHLPSQAGNCRETAWKAKTKSLKQCEPEKGFCLVLGSDSVAPKRFRDEGLHESVLGMVDAKQVRKHFSLTLILLFPRNQLLPHPRSIPLQPRVQLGKVAWHARFPWSQALQRKGK